MSSEDLRRRFAPRPRGRLDLSLLTNLVADLVDDEWYPDFAHAFTAPTVDLWSVTPGPYLIGRGEDAAVAVLLIQRITEDRKFAMTEEGVVALGRRAPLPLVREGRQ